LLDDNPDDNPNVAIREHRGGTQQRNDGNEGSTSSSHHV